MAAQLIRRFCNPCRADAAIANLLRIWQKKNEPVHDFICRFENEMDKVASFDENWLLKIFTWGLHNDLAVTVSLGRPSTLSAAFQLARDAALAAQMARRPGGQSDWKAGTRKSSGRRQGQQRQQQEGRADIGGASLSKHLNVLIYSPKRTKAFSSLAYHGQGQAGYRDVSPFAALGSQPTQRQQNGSGHRGRIFPNQSTPRVAVLATIDEEGTAGPIGQEAARHAARTDTDAPLHQRQEELDDYHSDHPGDHRGHREQDIQRSCIPTTKDFRLASQRRQRRKWQWKQRLERRRIRRAARAETQLVSNDDTGEMALMSQARPGETPKVSGTVVETAPVANAVGGPAPGTGVQDHLLLVVQAVVNGTRVPALVDSGASRSFISDKLQCRPPLQFVGAYSALELANGETIVSTGIAPRVLVCIGSVPCRLSLTAVPMMEGIQLILGKDWLDIINPLVDWRSNRMFLRTGSQLEQVQGIQVKSGQHCQIVDKGLPGLQHYFGAFKHPSATPTDDRKLGDTLAKLSTPAFWSYVQSDTQWSVPEDRRTDCSSPRTVDVPEGGVADKNFSPDTDPIPQGSPRERRTRAKNIAGRCVRQPVKTKIDFISMRQAARRANKSDQPMYLCVLRATELPNKPKKKPKSKAGAAKGMTEGEKRRMSKETGPITKEIPIPEVIRMKVSEADESIREQLQETLEEYRDVFPDKLPYGPPPKRIVDHEIDTTPGAAPPHKSPYRLSTAELDEMRRQIDALLEQGWIRPSSSPYGAPILFIPKKDGKWRMCIDYRALNKITVKNRYPLPKVDELMDRLHGAQYFTKIDLSSGYHQIRVRESDIHKTAFVSRYGSFEYLVMPFGLCNAPATFQRVMNTILREGMDKYVLVFLDDILIYSRTLEEHIQHIRAVLGRLRSEKMYGRLFKCDFFRTEVEYLGFDVGATGIKPSLSKVQAILEWPVPTSVTDVRSFLGLCSFYRKFIRWFSEIAAPLTDLTKKDQKFVWNDDADKAFNRLKTAMVTAPVLQLPDFDREFTVTTDASEVSVGAILQQNFGNGLQPVCYESRKLNPAETRYSAYERELLGITWAVGKWRHYLASRHFVIQTDHDSLKNLPNQPSVNRRVWKWVQVLQGYDCDIVHIPGKDNPADFLTRRSVKEMRSMVDVRAQEESLVQRLQLAAGDDKEDAIQRKLNEIFKKSNLGDAVVAAQLGQRMPKLFMTSTRVSLEENLKDSIKNGYTTDSRWTEILDQLEKAESKTTQIGNRDYRLNHGLIEIKSKDTEDKRQPWRLVVPDVEDARRTIMEEVHSVPYAGHLGYHKTLKKLQQNFYWPDHTVDVRDFVLGCEVCQTEKSVHRLPAGLLQPLALPEDKWTDVSLDFIMGLPVSERQNDGILTVVDRATKMVHLVPVRQTITAAETARVYWEQIGRLHGIPRSIVSDRDPRFVSKFWQEFWKILGSKLRMSSAHHPQTDGQTEAANRVVEQVLRCTIHDSQEVTHWERYLPIVEFVMNSSSSPSTGYSPFYLNYGYEPATPLTLIRDADMTHLEGVNVFVKRMKKTFRVAMQKVHQAQIRQKTQADQRRREQVFTSGDQVLLSTEHLQLKNAPIRKLKRRFVGPFYVVRRVGPVAYELELPESWRIHKVFHTSLLRPFRSSRWSTTGAEEEDAEIEPVDDEPYEVEKLLRWRWAGPSGKRHKEYLVLWKNYSIDDASWTPAENFTYQRELKKMVTRDKPEEDTGKE